MRNRNRRWLLAWTLASLFPHIMLYEVSSGNNGNSSNLKEVRGVFSPRMDYEQWTPLGRGDPLKNDPTYDYVPPVLDTVHYWIDPPSRKPDSPMPEESLKTEILVLGVSSKKPSIGTSAEARRDVHDPFLKFVEGPKFGIQSNYQRMSRPHYATSSYYPSLVYPSANKQNELVPNQSEQQVPYTVLMPPPLSGSSVTPGIISFQQALNSLTTEYAITKTTIPPVPKPITIQQSNLLYQSSTLGSKDEFRDTNQIAASSSQVTWRTPLKNSELAKNFVNIQPGTYMKLHTIIPDDDNSTGDENIKEITSVIGNKPQMHKGQVTDDALDIQNTYVNIGKPEAQMDSPTDMEISSVSVEPPRIPFRQHMLIQSTSPYMLHLPTSNTDKTNPTEMMSKLQLTPITLQTLQTMQTMRAPPISQSPISFTKPTTSSLHTLLQNELTFPTSTEIIPSTTTVSPTTTTTSSLTTDPLFKHYKQPIEPLKGPMYLIIQGHSKVKTYGPGKQIHGISIQETNEIPTSDEKDEFVVKHLHGFNKKDGNEGRLRQGKSSKLQSLSQLVQTGLGAIDFSETYSNRRKDDDVQEADLVVRYDVSAQTDNTSERYYKGIVEAGDMARNIKQDAFAKVR